MWPTSRLVCSKVKIPPDIYCCDEDLIVKLYLLLFLVCTHVLHIIDQYLQAATLIIRSSKDTPKHNFKVNQIQQCPRRSRRHARLSRISVSIPNQYSGFLSSNPSRQPLLQEPCGFSESPLELAKCHHDNLISQIQFVFRSVHSTSYWQR